MKLVLLILAISLSACSSLQQIQKKCKAVDGMVDTWVCEQP